MRCADTSNRSSCGEPTMTACSTFDYIELVSETSTDYIYPQMVLDTGIVDKTQWNYVMDSEGNNRARMYGYPTSPFVTAALYGRDYLRDSSLKRQRQPEVRFSIKSASAVQDSSRSSGLSANMNVLLIICMSILVVSLLYAVNRFPAKNDNVKSNTNYGYGSI